MHAAKPLIAMLIAVIFFPSVVIAGDGSGGGEAAGFQKIPLPTGLSKDTQFIIYYIDKRFELMHREIDKRFEMMHREMDKRFELITRTMDKRFEQVDKRFELITRAMDKRFEQVDKRFDEVNKKFEMIIDLMMAIVGAFAAIVAVTIGFAIWDRRTMTRPFEDKVKKIQQDTDKLNRLMDALRKLARHDPKLAEVLRSFSLL